MSKRIDWGNIKKEFEGSALSTRQIARNFCISPGAIRREAKLENWVKFDGSIIKDKELVGDNPVLGKIAVRKVKEIIEELGSDFLSTDEPLIAIYAKAYEQWVLLQIDITDVGIISYSSSGSSYISPEFTAASMLEKRIGTLASQLGLSLESRKKLKIQRQEDSTGSLFDLNAEIDELKVEI